MEKEKYEKLFESAKNFHDEINIIAGLIQATGHFTTRSEFQDLKTEMKELKSEIKDIKTELKGEIKEIRTWIMSLLATVIISAVTIGIKVFFVK